MVNLDIQKLKSAIDNIPVCLALLDTHGRIVNVNLSALNALGTLRDRMVGNLLWDLGCWNESAREIISANVASASRGSIRRFDESAVLPDGSSFDVEISLTPVKDGDGSITGLMATCVDVTERKRIQRELADSQQRLCLIFNNTSDALALLRVEPENRFVCEEANARFIESVQHVFPDNQVPIVGSERSDFLRAQGVPANIIEEGASFLIHAVTTGQKVEHEQYLQTKTNAVYLHITLQPVVDSSGKCTRVLWNSRDISSRKKAEQRLAESDERLRLALNAANLGIYDFNLQTGHAKVSDEYVGMLGFEPADFEESIERWRNRIHPDDRLYVDEFFQACASGQTTDFRAEFRLLTKRGEWKWILSRGKVASTDEYGKPIRLLGTHSDITFRKLSEDKLIKTNKELKEIIDALDESSLVSITDRFGTIIKVNKRFCEVARYEEHELIGKNHRIINSGFHSRQFWREFWSVINSGNVWRGEIKNKAKDGREYWVYSVINPIRDEKGVVTNFLSIRQDITDQKIYEQLLLQSNQRLAQIEQFIDLTTDAIQVSDEEGRLVYINRVASQRVGIDRDDCRQYFAKDFENSLSSSEAWQQHVEKLKRTGTLNYEATILNVRTRNTCPVEVTVRYVVIGGNGFVISTSRDITERKINESLLRETQKRLTEAQRMAKLGYWEYHLSMQTTWWSEEQYEINGVDKSVEVNQELFYGLIHPDDRMSMLELIETAIKHQTDASAIYRIVRPNGEIRVIHGKAHVTTDVNGQALRIYGVNQDITERVAAERALKESEETLRKAQSVAKIGSWKLDVKSGKLEWSEEVYSIFNVPKNSALSYEDFLSFVHPEDKEYVDEQWRAALTGAPYDIVHRIIVNETVKWVREQAELTFDEFRNLTFGFGTVQDITDQQILQEASIIFNKSELLTGLGSWRWSVKTNNIFWSDNVYNLFGLQKSAGVTFDRWLNAIHPLDRSRVVALSQISIEKREPFETEYRIMRKDEIRWLTVKGNVLTDHSDNVIEMYGIVRDVTSEKKTMEELIQARKAAEESAMIKDEFLSVMSHEIRTPLNSVIGLSNLLIKRSPREDQIEIIKTLKGSADNLLHLVNDILDFNKIRAGKLEMEFLPFSLNKFLKHLHASFHLSATDKGLQFIMHCDSRIPDLLVGDVTRLNQIFNNLVSNAIKFTHSGGVSINVEMKARSDDRCTISFRIKDTGIGIAPDKMNLIFQPFHQSERDISRKYGGTGLGLSIVKSLVDKLDGKLHVESEPGRGTLFVIDLQFAVDKQEVRSGATSLSISPDKAVKSRAVSVLYVEDVESNRFLVETLFADNNIACTVASSGKSALRFCKLKKYDVILMDIQMPVMDGYMVTDAIRNQGGGKNKQTPVIAFTAEPFSIALKNRISQHQMDDVIIKPFDAELLLEKIRRHTSKRPKNKTEFSFETYEKIFKNDRTKLKAIHRSVIKDLTRLQRKIEYHAERRSVRGIRAEAHRIRPILKMLHCDVLLSTTDQFGAHEKFDKTVKQLVKRTLALVSRILKKLSVVKFDTEL